MYTVFREKFSEESGFWKKILGDEKIHARWIRDLKPRVEKGEVYMEIDKFTEASLNKSMKF